MVKGSCVYTQTWFSKVGALLDVCKYAQLQRNLRYVGHTEQVRRCRLPLVPLLKKLSGGCQMSMIEPLGSVLNQDIHLFITLKSIPFEFQ